MALNYMFDRMGGMQIWLWTIAPKLEKKVTLDQHAREEGYKFIRDHCPRSNNKNQFMEWTDEQVHLPWQDRGLERGKGVGSRQQLFLQTAECKTTGILAVHPQELPRMVFGFG